MQHFKRTDKYKYKLLDRLLSTLLVDLIPASRSGTYKAERVFTAAILENNIESDFKLLNIGLNRCVSDSPLWHAEMMAIEGFYKVKSNGISMLDDKSRYDGKNLLLLASHQPCPMCASAIAWANIGTTYYYFDYQTTAKKFGFPDNGIIEQLFDCKDYSHNNNYFQSYSICNEIKKIKNQTFVSNLTKKCQLIDEQYHKILAIQNAKL